MAHDGRVFYHAADVAKLVKQELGIDVVYKRPGVKIRELAAFDEYTHGPGDSTIILATGKKSSRSKHGQEKVDLVSGLTLREAVCKYTFKYVQVIKKPGGKTVSKAERDASKGMPKDYSIVELKYDLTRATVEVVKDAVDVKYDPQSGTIQRKAATEVDVKYGDDRGNRPGMHVELCGLVKQTSSNGKQGRLLSYHRESQKWNILVLAANEKWYASGANSIDERISVKAANFKAALS